MKLKKPLEEKLRELRNKKRLSQSEVAKKLNITRQAISAWENGKSEPDKEILLKICELYGTSINELYEIDAPGKEGDMVIAESNSANDKADDKIDHKKVLSTLEQIGLSAFTIIFCTFPYVGVIAPIIAIIWMLSKRKKYLFVYIVCIMALYTGISSTLTHLDYHFDLFGNATIEKID